MLTAAAQHQDAVAFDALYRDNAADLFAYILTLVRDRACAEDLTHTSFERAYRRYDRFDARRGSARAWLYGIARNAALDELRRRKRSVRLAADLPDPAGADSWDDAALERRATVQAAIAALDPRDRELVALKFYAGLTNPEIARVLGISASNAGTRLNRAVNRLREECNA